MMITGISLQNAFMAVSFNDMTPGGIDANIVTACELHYGQNPKGDRFKDLFCLSHDTLEYMYDIEDESVEGDISGGAPLCALCLGTDLS